MKLRTLELRRFRSHTQLRLEGLGRLVLVWGPNGSGKTNLLEAVAYLAGVRLRPISRDADLVQFGASGFRVRAQVESADGRVNEAEVMWESGRRRFFRDGVPARGGAPGFPVVVTFTPDDLGIVKGGPEARRRILEQDLAAHLPAAREREHRYARILRQRNALLVRIRDGAARERELLPWDEALLEEGSMLQVWRAQAVARLAPLVDEAHRILAGAEAPEPDHDPGPDALCLRYLPSAEDTDAERETGRGSEPAFTESAVARRRTALRAQLLRLRPAEIARGHTLVGPHRDDLVFELGGRDMRYFASQGQQRSAVIALKAAVVEWARGDLDEPPVVLLDDVWSELDPQRQSRLGALWRDVQTFMTATEPVSLSSARVGSPDDVTSIALPGIP